MDGLDREILAQLQDDGRLSITELAERVGLSVSACHRRVRDLEQSGAVERYRAVVSPAALGLTFEAIVFVTIDRTDPDTVSAFESAVAAIDNVVAAERLFGEPDYMLRVLARDLQGYQELFDAELGSVPGVARLTSTLVMKRVGTQNVIPTATPRR